MEPVASAELEAFINESIRRSEARGYHPRIFIDMKKAHGSLGAINRLVVSGDIQSGFRRLHQLGMLDWTIEQAVLNFPHEFLPTVREAAQFRLEEARKGKS